MSDDNLSSSGPDPADPWSGEAERSDLGARRRKIFDDDGRAVRKEKAADESSPAPGGGQESPVAEESPWELDGPPTISPGPDGSSDVLPDWAQPAPPGQPASPPAFPSPATPPWQPAQPPTQAGPGQAWAPQPGPNQAWQNQAWQDQGWQNQQGAVPAYQGNWAPTPPGHTPFYQPGIGYYGTYQESSQAALAAWLSGIGLASILFCALGIFLCPAGWVIASKELKGIREGRRDPVNQGTARAGQIMGIIGTSLMALGIIGFALIIVLGASGA